MWPRAPFPGSSSTGPSERARRLLLGLLLAVALLLRVLGAGYGLPDVYHPDEPRIVERAVRFHSGDLDPRFFNWPSLYMYLLSGVYGAVYGLGGSGTPGVVEAFARDPTPFYLLGRVVTALFGTATVAALYLVASAAWSPAAGLLASLFLTVGLLHVRDSHYVTPDVPLTCLVTVAGLLVLRYHRDGRLRHALGSGVAAGLAASMKYPGGLMLVPLWLAHALRSRAAGEPWARRLAGREVALGVAAAAVAFAAGTPYAVLTPRAFAAGVLDELSEVASVQFGNEADLPAYLFHLVHSLPVAMGVPLLALALLGLGLALRRRTSADVLLLAFALPYFLVICTWSSRFERYALPLLPTLAMLAAASVVGVAARVRGAWGQSAARWCPGLGVAVAATLLVAPEAARIWQFHALLARPDTRMLAAAWIRREIPLGSSIALEPYTPSLPVGAGDRGYRIARLMPYDVDRLVAGRVDYVVLSSFVYGRHENACARFAAECRFYREVESRASLLLALDPRPPGEAMWVGDLYSPLTRLAARTNPGPGIRIYRLPAEKAS